MEQIRPDVRSTDPLDVRSTDVSVLQLAVATGEVFVKVNGELHYMWRALEHDVRCLILLRRSAVTAKQR